MLKFESFFLESEFILGVLERFGKNEKSAISKETINNAKSAINNLLTQKGSISGFPIHLTITPHIAKFKAISAAFLASAKESHLSVRSSCFSKYSIDNLPHLFS